MARQPPPAPDSIIVPRPLTRYIILLVISLLGGVASFLITFHYADLIGYLVLIISVWTGMWAISEITRGKPVLVINNAGIAYRKWGIDFLEWNDVLNVFLRTDPFHRVYLCLMLRNPEKIFGGDRRHWSITRLGRRGDLWVLASSLPIDALDLLRMARRGVFEASVRLARRPVKAYEPLLRLYGPYELQELEIVRQTNDKISEGAKPHGIELLASEDLDLLHSVVDHKTEIYFYESFKRPDDPASGSECGYIVVRGDEILLNPETNESHTESDVPNLRSSTTC